MQENEAGKAPDPQTEASASNEVHTKTADDVAQEFGWRPKEKWTGDPDKWTDSATYLERRIKWSDPRALQDRVKQLENELKSETAKQAEAFQARLDQMDKANQRLLKSQREKIYAEIAEKKREAAADGDIERYQALEKQEDQTRERFSKEDEAFVEDAKPAPKQEQAKSAEYDPEIAAWWAANPEVWMDQRKATYAGMLYDQAERNPSLKTTKEKLQFVEEGLRKATGAPQAAENGNDAVPMPGVESGSRTANGPRKKGFGDIPAEEKKIYQRHIKEGLYKDEADAAAAHWGN